MTEEQPKGTASDEARATREPSPDGLGPLTSVPSAEEMFRLLARLHDALVLSGDFTERTVRAFTETSPAFKDASAFLLSMQHNECAQRIGS